MCTLFSPEILQAVAVNGLIPVSKMSRLSEVNLSWRPFLARNCSSDQCTGKLSSARKTSHTNTATKTGVAYGNSHLACV